MDSVGRASPFTRSYLLEAHPVSLARNVFTIGFDPEFEDHIALVDNALIENVANVCVEEGRHEFMLMLCPLVVEGGTGSPLNPIAMF